MLNDLAWDLVQQLMLGEEDLRVDIHNFDNGGVVIDCGVETVGSLSAGLALAEVCTAGLAEISIHPGTIGELSWPHVFVQTDNPIEACLLSQYAGWSISVKDFFGMGSGPMRARAGKEELFTELEEAVIEHVAEEEDVILPLAAAQLDVQTLGMKMQRRRDDLRSQSSLAA